MIKNTKRDSTEIKRMKYGRNISNPDKKLNIKVNIENRRIITMVVLKARICIGLSFKILNNKFIAHSFHGLNVLVTNFFPEFSYMNINCSTTNYDIPAPYCT